MRNAAAQIGERMINVGIAALAVSNDPDAQIVTHALGSCIGVVVWDPAMRLGGLLHFLLPSVRSARAGGMPPEAFADTGVPRLIDRMSRHGANPGRLIVRIAGGASMGTPAGRDFFDIGARNYAAAREILDEHGLAIRSEDVGGSSSRTLILDVGTGSLLVRTPHREREL
jgi:chemotaxis protein CheD